MNFLLSDEQNEFAATLHRLLADKCGLRGLHAAFDSAEPFDAPLWSALVEFGLAGLLVPQAQGGAGLEMIDAALAAEILGYHAAPVPWFGQVLAALALVLAGDTALAARYLPALADGSLLGTVALQEAPRAWQPGEWRLAADAGRLTGRKGFVPAGAEAGLIIIGLAGGGLAVVEPGATGLARTPLDGVDRTRRLAALDFAATPCQVLSTDPAIATRLVDAALVLLAADAFGGASQVLAMTTEYDRTRVQFGRPVGSFQAVKHQLANMALSVEPTRGLYWYAAHAFDHRRDEAAAAAALAKAHITEVFLQAARDGTELHGGIGYTWEYDIHIWLKRAMQDWAWAGNPGIHRARYADLVGW